jgi:hypothetical protein
VAREGILRSFLTVTVLALFAGCTAASAVEIVRPDNGIVRIDWQYPPQLPPRFRNHCTYEYFTGRPYCSDHCGIDYQFYYCSEISFGCCHLGRGYCDWRGILRCSP